MRWLFLFALGFANIVLSQPVLRVLATPAVVGVGDTVTFRVTIENAVNVRGYGVEIKLDSTKVKWLVPTSGTFFSQMGQEIFFSQRDTTHGIANAAGTLTGNALANGSGWLCDLRGKILTGPTPMWIWYNNNTALYANTSDTIACTRIEPQWTDVANWQWTTQLTISADRSLNQFTLDWPVFNNVRYRIESSNGGAWSSLAESSTNHYTGTLTIGSLQKFRVVLISP